MPQQAAAKSRWFGHPAIIVILAIILFVDLVSIPSLPWKVSMVRQAILGESNWRGAAHGRPVPGAALRTDTGIEWAWPGEPEYEARFESLGVNYLDTAGVFRDMQRYEGFYHLTRRVEQFFVWPEGLSAQEQQALLDAILVAVDRESEYEQEIYFVPDMIRVGVRKRTLPIYSGYVRNALAGMVALALLVCCTYGKPWLWRPHVYGSRARRIARGLCPECGYDQAGLKTSRCPECGVEWDVHESSEPSS